MFNWPTTLSTFLLATYGPSLSIAPLGGMSGASVWRARFADGSVIVKTGSAANEFHFYREVAPTLRANGIAVPELRWSGRDDGAYWLALEDIPQPLPRARWLADPELLAMLRRLHRLELAPPPDLPMFQPSWTEEMSEKALSCFTPLIATELRPN